MTASEPRRALHGLALVGAMACTPLATRLPPWVFIVLGLALAWRYAHEYRGVRLPSAWWLRVALVLSVAIGVYGHFGTLLGRDPGLALLVALVGLKCLELRTLRDDLLVLFLFYLVLAGGFLYEQTMLVGLWAAATVLVSVAVLVHLNQPDALGGRQALGLAAGLVLRALPIMLVLYVLFPRLSGALWGVPADAYAGLIGMPDSMRPGSLNLLSASDAVAFRVEFEDGALPPPRALYWRGRVLTHTDGREWTAPSAGRPATDPPLIALATPLRYTIHLEPSNKPWLFALELPAEGPAGARRGPGYTLERPVPVRERLSYTLISYTRYRTGGLTEAERADALQLPAGLDPRVRALAMRLRRATASGNPRAIAHAALAYFRHDPFHYTLAPPRLGDDPVAEFLFETRRGYCEHYAAAFVTLMRAAGVPSRVVIGYQGGEYNPAGRYLIVRQADAHAWAEIWTPDSGWERVDPTAAVAPERVEYGMEALRRLNEQGLAFGVLPEALLARALELGAIARFLRHVYGYWDYANLSWHRWVSGYGEQRQRALLERLGLRRLDPLEQAGWIVAATAGLLLLYAQAARHAARRGRDPVARLYARFCRKLARAGLARAPHEGPLAFAARVRAQRPELGTAVEDITWRYVRLRYAPLTADARREEWRALEQAVARFRVIG